MGISTIRGASATAQEIKREAEDLIDYIDQVDTLISDVEDLLNEAEPFEHAEHGKGYWVSEKTFNAVTEAHRAVE